MVNTLLFNNLVTLALNSSTIKMSSVLFYWHWLMQIINLFMLMLEQLDMLGMLECLVIQH